MANSGDDHHKWYLTENDFKGYSTDEPFDVMLALTGRIAKAKHQSEVQSKGRETEKGSSKPECGGEARKLSETTRKSVVRASSVKARVAGKGVVIRENVVVENKVDREDDLKESIHQLLINPCSGGKGKGVDMGGSCQAGSDEEESHICWRSARAAGCEMEVGESSGSKEEIKKKRKCSQKNGRGRSSPALAPAPAPTPMPPEFMDRIARMGGKEIMLVIQKDLTESDMNKHLCRLTIPLKQIRKDSNFLREEEKMRLEADENIEVKVFCTNLSEHLVSNLTMWEMRKSSSRDDGKEPKPKKSSFMYALKSPWNKVAKASKLRTLDTIQVWSFRVDSEAHPDELWFAVIKVPREGNCRSTDSGGGGSGSSSSGNLA